MLDLNQELNEQRFNKDLYELLPHRPPMLLINDILAVSESSASAMAVIDAESSFYESGNGVPAYVGLEYMGQTAALIAGYQLKHGLVKPHLGFLLGTRSYKTNVDYFAENTRVIVECFEKAVVGDELATFDCTIRYENETTLLVKASLSVFRKAK